MGGEEGVEVKSRRRSRLTTILLVILLAAAVAFASDILDLLQTRAHLKTLILLAAIVILLAAGLAWGGGSRTAVRGSPVYLMSESAREAVRAAEKGEEEQSHDPVGPLALMSVGLVLLVIGLLL